MAKDIAVFDVETGGFNWTDGLAQIAIAVVETDTWKIKETYSAYIWEPDREYGEGAFQVNKINPVWLKAHGKSWEEVEPVIFNMLSLDSGNLVCAYNTEFDCGFLHKRGITIPRAIDPLKIARIIYKGYDNKLETLAKRLLGEDYVFAAHDARGDVITTVKCLAVLAQEDAYGAKALLAANVDYDEYMKKQRSRRRR